MDLNTEKCIGCGKRLFDGNFIGKIEIKCDRCKKINLIEKRQDNEKNCTEPKEL